MSVGTSASGSAWSIAAVAAAVSRRLPSLAATNTVLRSRLRLFRKREPALRLDQWSRAAEQVVLDP